MSVMQLGATSVGLGTILSIVDEGHRIALDPAAVARIAAARTVVDRYMHRDEPIYGLNTGLGGNVGYRIPPEEIEAFQVKMVRGRCIGVGEPFPERAGRAMLLSRIVGMAQGGSGISPAVLDLAVAMFNAGITPVVPGRGSIGAGDLGLCAHLGAALIGLGEAYLNGRRMPAAEALRAAGLAPARLGPKDGLAILNASAVSCGYGALVLAELSDLLSASMVVAALAGEGYAANPRIFDARLAAARPARGQVQAAAAFRAILGGSYLHDPGAASLDPGCAVLPRALADLRAGARQLRDRRRQRRDGGQFRRRQPAGHGRGRPHPVDRQFPYAGHRACLRHAGDHQRPVGRRPRPIARSS
jgi:histidine ammonia-lyase